MWRFVTGTCRALILRAFLGEPVCGWVEHCFWAISSILTGSQLPLHPPCDCFLTPVRIPSFPEPQGPALLTPSLCRRDFRVTQVRSCLGTSRLAQLRRGSGTGIWWREGDGWKD